MARPTQSIFLDLIGSSPAMSLTLVQMGRIQSHRVYGMATVRSNLPEVETCIRGLSDLLNLSTPRQGRRLGDAAIDVIATGIIIRTIDLQQQPDDEPLEANRGKYGEAKRQRGIKVGIGFYRTKGGGESVGGEMLSFDQVRGETTIGPTQASMTYGITPECQLKAEWFTEGNPRTGAPPRPFYELNDAIEAELDDLFDAAIDQGIRDLGGYEY